MTKHIKFFSNSENLKFKNKFLDNFSKILQNGIYLNGDFLKKFERDFSKKMQTNYCLGVSSGTDALIIAIKSLNLSKGDEIIVPSHTATASISAIVSSGAVPVFADIGFDFNIDPKSVLRLISKKTRAIIVVHLYGLMADIQKLIKISKKYNLYLIEDCAQSCGSSFNSKFAGSFGIISCFSFYPSKNLSTIGDSGAILTNNNKLFKKCKQIREYGWNQFRESTLDGINSRMTELNASVLLLKLKNLEKNNLKRNKIALRYKIKLNNKFVKFIEYKKDFFNSFHLFVIRVKKRNKLFRYLKTHKIEALIHYKKPNHAHKSFKKYKSDNLVNTKKLVKEIISLPMYPDLKIKDQLDIIRIINNFFKNEDNRKKT